MNTTKLSQRIKLKFKLPSYMNECQDSRNEMQLKL